jgi:hypothetical protein
MNLRFWERDAALERDINLALEDYITMKYEAMNYGLTGQPVVGGNEEDIGGDFQSLVQLAYKRDGVVFACMEARRLLFSEARFAFERRRNGRVESIFTNAALAPLEVPWPQATTGDLLSRMIQDADLSGCFVGVRLVEPQIRRLRPDWCLLALGSRSDPDIEKGDPEAELLGIVYHPGGENSGREPIAYLREQVVYWAPIPDPEAEFRGMSWLEPVIREVMGDKASTEHKLRYFDHGGPPYVMVFDSEKTTKDDFKAFLKKMKRNEGLRNAYKTIYLRAAAKPAIVGANLKQSDFSVTQAAGETRIASAARVPPVIAGLKDGLQGSSLNQGNYGAARRQFADLVMRPLWRGAAGALAVVIDVPAGAELIHDDRHISALQEDVSDRADIQQTKAATLRQLVDGGFEPTSALAAVEADDFSLLVHTGKLSVQLQDPNEEPDSQNGKGDVENVPAPAGRE